MTPLKSPFKNTHIYFSIRFLGEKCICNYYRYFSMFFPPKKLNNYFCDKCNVLCSNKSTWELHIFTAKHKNTDNKKVDIVTKTIYDCSFCGFSSIRLNDWKNHLTTKKHLKNTSKEQTPSYTCQICDKVYSNYKSFWCHSKKCKEKEGEQQKKAVTMNDLILMNDEKNDVYSFMNMLFKENQEMRNFMTEQMKTMVELAKPNITNNQNNIMNGNINKFNINVFLNEKCKNAMNLSEFLESIVVTREDLENNARLGFVDGMTKIIMDNMKRLDLFERSIHCTDSKRETMYIKDDDKWTKEENMDKLNLAIQKVSTKSIQALMKLQDETFTENDNDNDNSCSVIMRNSVAGIERYKLYPKVIKNIARETLIDKNMLT